jgi:hypothetical protein
MLKGPVLDPQQYADKFRDTDFHGFTKFQYIPIMDSTDTFPSWYRKLVGHGCNFGVYITPWEYVCRDHPLGSIWNTLPPRVKHNVVLSGGAIAQLLETQGVIPEHHPIRRHFTGQSDGYHMLHNILVQYHPLLRANPVPVPQPTMGDNESIHRYMQRVQDWYFEELATGNHMSDKRLITCALAQIKPTFRHAVNIALKPLLIRCPHDEELPFDLHFHQLANNILIAVDQFTPQYNPPSRSQNPYRNNYNRTSRTYQVTADTTDYPTFEAEPQLPPNKVLERTFYALIGDTSNIPE